MTKENATAIATRSIGIGTKRKRLARERAERQRIARLDRAMLDEFGALKFQARAGIAPRPG
ncbi:MAG: hypothetical protein HY521_03845 [Proteobacteria bacterium]|nr:hypothetical protein [Pseudomonadota bacterium]